MNRFAFLLLCTAAAASANLYENSLVEASNSLANAKQKLVDAMGRICTEKSEEELEDVANNLIECGEGIEFGTSTICSILQSEVPRCLGQLTDSIEECLPARSRGIPDLILSSLNATTAHMCRTDGEHILEVVLNPCIYRQSYKLQRCKTRVKSRLQRYRTSSPSVQDTCDALNSLKPCLMSHLEESCGNHITREAYTQFFDAALSPCNERNDIDEIELLSK